MQRFATVLKVCLTPKNRGVLANSRANGEGLTGLTNDFRVLQDNWVQITPLGDFPNAGPLDASRRHVYPKGVIQRVNRQSVTDMVNDFNAFKKEMGDKFAGLPWYIGHPDMDSERYRDSKSYGWIMEVKDGGDQGLMGNVKWTDEGKALKEGGSYKYFSPCWDWDHSKQMAMENGKPVLFPNMLISVGFTNQPQIPVLPLSNETRPQALSNEVVAANTLIDLALRRGGLLENERPLWLEHFAEDFEGATMVLANAGTSEGAKKGWETRRGNMAAKKAKAPKAAAKVAAKTRSASRAKRPAAGSKAAWAAKDKADAAAGEKAVAAVQASRATSGSPEKPSGEKIELPKAPTTPPPLPQRAASTAASSMSSGAKSRGFLGLGRLAGENPIEHIARLTGFGKP
jgi:phage I-like protein